MVLFWSRHPDHNRTKIGCIRFLTYFGSAMSGMYLDMYYAWSGITYFMENV